MSNRIFIPTDRIPSAQFRFEQKMISVDPRDKEKPWDQQRRIPMLLKGRVAESRRTEEEMLFKLQLSAKHTKKSPIFLVVKQKQHNKKQIFVPIGFPNRRFGSVEKVVNFAKEIGRQTVRVMRGQRQRDYSVFN